MAEDLSAERTPGFKVGEKKTVDEYQKLGMSSSQNSEGSACAIVLFVRHGGLVEVKCGCTPDTYTTPYTIVYSNGGLLRTTSDIISRPER